MPEYLAPGVFIEETSFRSKSIEGVGTSVASLVGPTRTGPLSGVPEALTSFADFERTFGDAADLTFKVDDTTTTTVPNYTSHAARAFFDNGGKQLFVARVSRAADDGSGPTALTAAKADDQTDVTFTSRFPGAVANYALELHWKSTEHLLVETVLNTVSEGEVVFLVANSVPVAAKSGAKPTADKFPMDVKAIVKRIGADFVVQNTAVALKPGTTDPIGGADPLTALKIAALPTDAKVYRVSARRPQQSALADGTLAVLKLKKSGGVGLNLSAFDASFNFSTFSTLVGFLDAKGSILTLPAARNAGLATDVSLPLAVLQGQSAFIESLSVRLFDLDVHRTGKDGEIIWRTGSLTVAPGLGNSLDALLPVTPARKMDELTQPVACALGTSPTGTKVLAALEKLYDPADLAPPAGSLDGPRCIIKLTGGTDGSVPAAVDYAGTEDLINGSTGLAALESVEDISIVMVPAAAAHATTHKAVLMEMQKHCRKMRYRVGIVDPREGMSLGEVREFRNDFDDTRLALYYPWVVISDPTGARLEMNVPPSGFMAGIFARTDVDRGVHKAPANEVVLGALKFEQDINKFQQELLNPNGINCLRSFPDRGHRVWGGRTLSSDPEWKYVNVRRYFHFLERSIEKSTQWAVFEPNGEGLWANIRSSVEDFLYNEWKSGRLLGGTAKDAYFVRCDRSTMTQNDIDNGRMVCVVGVAALKPAEFVIFRIGQKTAEA